MQEKSLEIERVDDAGGASVVFRLHGPLLLGNFFSFQSMVRNDQAKLLIVDVADVPYIDSAGIGCSGGRPRVARKFRTQADYRWRFRAIIGLAESYQGRSAIYFREYCGGRARQGIRLKEARATRLIGRRRPLPIASGLLAGKLTALPTRLLQCMARFCRHVP